MYTDLKLKTMQNLKKKYVLSSLPVGYLTFYENNDVTTNE